MNLLSALLLLLGLVASEAAAAPGDNPFSKQAAANSYQLRFQEDGSLTGQVRT